MVFSLLKTKPKKDDSLVLLVDVGSASVGTALVRLGEGVSPRILSTIRKDIAFQGVVTSTRFLSAMGHALDSVLDDTHKRLGNKTSPAQVFVTLSSPWFMLKGRQVLASREKPFVVTKEILDGFIDKDIERLKIELKETLPPSDVYIMERKIIQMKLNGYDIKNPYGQITTRIDIGATVSISSARVVKRIEHSVLRRFGTPEVHFGAFPVVAFSTIRDIFPNEQQFIFLDVTGEATDISLIERDVLINTVSFARGKNYFIREISSAFRTVHEEAMSLFDMYLANTLETAKRSQVERVIKQAEKEWIMRFEKTLETFARNGVLPRSLFFTADQQVKDFFERLIKGANPGLFLSSGFEVRYLDQFIVGQFVSFEPEVVRDPFLVTEALLAAKTMRYNEHK